MQICTNALKAETFNVGLHAAKAYKATTSRNAVDQGKSGVLSFSSPDQTFTLTASIDKAFKSFISQLTQPVFA
jgi:hypothetical protein